MIIINNHLMNFSNTDISTQLQQLSILQKFYLMIKRDQIREWIAHWIQCKNSIFIISTFFIFWFRKANCFRPFFWRFHFFFLVYHVWMQACGQNPFPLRTNFKQLTPSFLLLMFAVFYYKRNIFITILGSNSKEKERGTCLRVHLCISKLLCLFCAC